MPEDTQEERVDFEALLPQRFPDMQPIRSAPSLSTFNGIGTSVFGRRNIDEETRTHVKTLCVCFLFAPIFALRAYRVADGPGGRGWAFLGRHSLSGFARSWNCLVLSAVLVLSAYGAWSAYSDSPDYRATQQYDSAQEDIASGDYVAALHKLTELADGDTARAPQARSLVKDVITEKLAGLQPAQAEAVVQIAVDSARHGRPLADTDVVLKAAMSLAERHEADDPKFAVTIMAKVISLAGDDESFHQKRRAILERAVAKQPQDPGIVTAFAVLLEAEKKFADCKKLLLPISDKLGDTEGARLLGLIHSRDGEFDAAHKLLAPYCKARLAALKIADEKFRLISDSISKKSLQELNAGVQPRTWYAEHKGADEAKQQRMVREFVADVLVRDRRYRTARDAVALHSPVVSVALSLGVVMLRRARGMTPEDRANELKAAEDVFLAIRSTAGESEQFRLFYGQVLYWLGKAAAGKKLLDGYLAETKRDPARLAIVAGVMRSVGDESTARALAEEAYATAKSEKDRQSAAAMRSVMSIDVDDEIKWRERCDLSDKRLSAALSTAKGKRTARVGENADAEKHFREAIASYAMLSKTGPLLNNAALAYQALFQVTGDPEDLRKASAMMDEALTMVPGESILLNNVALTLEVVGTLDLLADRVDFKALRIAPDPSMLTHLFRDGEGFEKIKKQVGDSEPYRKSIDYFQKAMLLSPKSPRPYAALVSRYDWAKDIEMLRELLESLGRVELDLANIRQQTLDYYSGKDEAKDRERLKHSISRLDKQLAQISEPGVTRSIVLTHAIRTESATARLGLSSRLDALIEKGEALYATTPSTGLSTALISAHLWRASRQLSTTHPSYKAARERCKWSLTADIALLLVAEKDERLREAATANTDVLRAVALVEERHRVMPLHGSAWRWAIVKQFKPSVAPAIGATLAKNEVRNLVSAIMWQIGPLNAETAVNRYWLYVLAGERTKGEAVLSQVEKNGAPLPMRK
jgi:tetratricopeptide (TPR) repeat protein